MSTPMMAESDFRYFVDRLPKAVMMASRGQRITYVNRAFARITGYQPEEVLGQKPSLLSSGLHSASFYSDLWQRLNRNGRWEGLIWNRRKDGNVYPQWLTIYQVEGDSDLFYAGVFMDVGEVTRASEPLASMAYYDPLTELPNRTLFTEFLDSRVRQRPEPGKTFAVMFIDLDYFKEINDLHGHAVGDKVLRQAAQCIRSVVRQSDIVARLSGDEFAAIVELGENGEQLEQICQRMVSAFRAPVIADGREHFLSVSIGTALFPRDGTTGPQLLEKSDKAMYAAKTAGRACFRAFDSALSEVVLRHQRLSEALLVSLKTAPQEFSVVYQPQFSVKRGDLVGLEALIRWQHPEFGAVSPGEFVPLAEVRGLMHPLTERLVALIRHDLAGADQCLQPDRRLAINLSARHIADERLGPMLEPLFNDLERLGWRPELEITETHLMHLSRHCLDQLRQFGQQGVRVAIDDFGTGYSSLAYLHNLPIHVLKIDRQFISRLGGSDSDDQIVSAILAIAAALGLETVAEGLETEAQRRVLQSLHCDRVQGFLLARPGPWDQIISTYLDLSQSPLDYLA
ncbi:MAG: EAL domain-containing protein [Marinobacter sp.]|uniref:putative bifunctional diguanylate cyclase/phosphodiesterase n=1 Tax=Marinobacter sp. TaxID=50741 RepID=UPI00299DE2C8|nr:EAL domain-containing protein [Marinobacter sp.]MDX1633591.1 EAL domain-containing protein [Marinobacter sp.]